MKIKLVSGFGLSFLTSILLFSGIVFAQGFQDVISALKDVGVFQFYLPFILVFAILFGLLTKTKIFGDQKGLAIVIALAASGFIMVYVPVGTTFSQFLTNFVGNTVVIILTLVAILIFSSMLQTGGLNISALFTGGVLWVVVALLLLVVFGVFVASGGTSIFPGIKISAKPVFGVLGGLSPATLAIIILIIGTGLIVWMFSKGEEKKGTPKGPGG